ncbi:MAG: sugar-binding protein [Caldilineaceae bacterium]
MRHDQSFERGFILQSSDVEFCQDNLYNHARAPEWQPLLLVVTNDGAWRNACRFIARRTARPVHPSADSNEWEVATPLPTPTATTGGRATPPPGTQWRLYASTQPPQTLDGSFADWAGNWFPINTVVQGNSNYAGPDDIAGDFQAAWSRDGLFLAVRVRDDRYRAGPNGTDMWQGDGFELHLDRFLALDYDSAIAGADDYQLGISFGPDRNELRVYRWLPFEKEGQSDAAGAITAVDGGYDLELFLPWSRFDIGGDEVGPGQTLGFNLSINDNDADSPAQETVLSASPSRTTYNNPTE